MPSRRDFRRLADPSIALLVCLFLLTGCTKPKSARESATSELPLAGVKLRLLVIDDPTLATAVRKLQGQWRSETGAILEVAETTEAELLGQKTSQTDAAICESGLLGALAERPGLVEIPESLRADGQRDWTDIFELPRAHEAVWGSSILAVPLGSPVLVCYYRADLLKALEREPPQTWDEYRELAESLADRGRLGKLAPPANAPWSGTMEPLGPGWAGLVLLARAASAVHHPDNFSTWFDIKTMDPLVDSPPMIHALDQLAAAARFGPADQLKADPAAVRAAFWRGECGMALCWPTAAGSPKAPTGPMPPADVAELPGSPEHYNVDRQRWEKREPGQPLSVPLLAIAGRIGVVFEGTKQSSAAAELLLWLSASQVDPPPVSRSPWTTLLRQPQLAKPRDWVEAPFPPAVAADYAKQTQATFQRTQWIFAPRIPGRREYVAALDEAVAAAVRGEKAPAAALAEAAQKWREITTRLGIEKQRAAYLRSLGLEP
jgi:ABC-type glycerol-3-phosphate transport system substrate-binding protein